MSQPRPRRRSSLVLPKQPLLVMPRLAAAIGLNEAMFIQQMTYWLENEDAGHWRDGRKWVYNTYDEWHRQFPFWSVRTIRRIVTDLENRGLLLSTDAYNQMRVDKTKWYTIDDDALLALEDELDRTGFLVGAVEVANVASPPAGNADAAEGVANLDTSTGLNRDVEPASVARPIPETTTETSPERGLEISRDTPAVSSRNSWSDRLSGGEQAMIQKLVQQFLTFGDESTPPNTFAQIANYYLDSGLDPIAFLDRIDAARAQTGLANVEKERADSTPARPRKNRMGVFIRNLERELKITRSPGKRTTITPSAGPDRRAS